VRLCLRVLWLLVPALLPGCGARAVRPVPQSAIVIVTGDLTPEGVAGVSTMVRDEQDQVWVMCGEVVTDRRWRAFAGPQADVRLLNAAGVDAIALNPDWLQSGIGGARGLVDRSRFAVLGANVADTAGIPVGHPWAVRSAGGVRLGMTAVRTDTADIRFRQRGFSIAGPLPTARRILPFVRARASATALFVVPASAGCAVGYDLAVGDPAHPATTVAVPGEDSAVLLDFRLGGTRTVEVVGRRVLALADAGRDPVCLGIADSGRRAVDSLASSVAAVLSRGLTPQAFTRLVATYALDSSPADCFVADSLLAKAPLRAGPLTLDSLLGNLREFDPCVVVGLTGQELRELLRDRARLWEWRGGATAPPLVPGRTYRVLTTLEFLQRHPGVAVRGYEPLRFPLWKVAAKALSIREGR